MKYSVGYNHDIQLLKLVEIFKDYVDSFYFPIPNKYTGSGRAIAQDNDYENEINQIIETCKSSNIQPQLLINPTCEGGLTANPEHMKKIISYISNKDIKQVIVSSPIFMKEIKKELSDVEIHSSVNCFMKNSEHAQYLKDNGADVITIDRDINRDLELIKEIKNKVKLKLKMLVNEGCLRNCPYRQSHFNMISHNKDTKDFDDRSCITSIEQNPEKVFSIPFIRPEDIKHYDGLIDQFKLATRTKHTLKIALIMDAYKCEEFHGNLLDILSTRGLFRYFDHIDNDTLTENDFFNKMIACDNDCNKCDYCKQMLKKSAITF